MGASYSAVGWNRQKKIYDWIIFSFCVVYLATFIVLTAIFNPDYTFETVLIRSTSTLAVLILHVILSIGPLTRLNKKFFPLLYNRRHLGVTMFCIILVHGAFGILQFHSLGNVNPFVSLFTSNTHYDSIADFPFQALGFFALIIFFLMAITSHDFWLHNLSPKIWKTLHMFVYLAYFLVVMHVMLGVIQYETNPVFIIIMIIGAITLISLHLVAGLKEARKDKINYNLKEEGFVFVCGVTEIEESRAKIFCIDKERIAVYKHEDKLYAIHNVCKHQGGPLGEGKIIDGCITCPWHGYQYLPQNGQSPPPFKEMVNTYDVKVKDNKVWLNPMPYAEGTERPGANIR
ncbi:Rieske 2Fe-2S domain-containing protein [Panacibacter ginsenosidivorans]|uniref:Rieske 2Fe-2S domain-containing protein n=1 Tax=Panacibacter ginsenosidivorans TaxID=1813871 RepID=A0A5B8VBY7_9BACT|nr:Rieske 2Fe-2S domain-containing protein [Panacibacter ginsenosidivorans]QEC68944.1 Rieske 2Fe-2S domain-containing protein [Panacibacter ginsenosidivorans]